MLPCSHLAVVRVAVATATIALALNTASTARAGGGPENIFLVVNARSWSSQTVANHYVRLRSIPVTNVFYLDWSGDNEAIDVETFRTKLLGPILAEIERRDIGDHIDYVVYSTDFPWAVECGTELKGRSVPQFITPTASLNGLTYLYQDVVARRLEFLMLDSNKYFRRLSPREPPTSHGFRSWYGWGKGGSLLEAGGERYMLSMVLGVTTGRGCSTRDVVRYLTRSVGADYTKPTGTIYFPRNDDVRSKTRHDLFPPAIDLLKALGVRGEVVEGMVPQRKADVMGAVIGSERFTWQEAHSNIRPGAIVEHLTSTGGVMNEGGGQTPLTENLLSGAAGSSGAVTEPFAIPQKFPNAFIHAHYARGCSLAEAFYQSINGPYQLLIVGDPLCRPWADPPRVSVTGVEVGATVKDVLTLTPSAKVPAGASVARYELYSDGMLYDECDGSEKTTLSIDTRRLADGYHELRVMAVGNEPIESRGGVLVPVTVSNHGGSVTFERVDDRPIRWGEPLRLRAKSPGAGAIVLAQGSRTLAQGKGEQAEFTFDPKLLGMGPVSLQAAALGGSVQTNRISAPLEFEVETNEPLASYQIPGGAVYKPGMLIMQDMGEPRPVFATVPERWLTELGVMPNEVFSLVGFFTVDRDCEFQFQFRHAMQAALLVDDRPLYEAKNAERVTDYVPVALRSGLHKIEIRGRASQDMRLDIRYGHTGVECLATVGPDAHSAAAIESHLHEMDETVTHERFMRAALREAEQALAEDEVPIGAVIVHEEKIIAAAHNQREQLHDPTAHAEMIAITQAAEALGDWRLENCLLYVTLEPCPMCAGAIIQARVPWVIYGAPDPKAGAVDTLYQLLRDPRLNHRCQTVSGVLGTECGALLTRFFQEKRRQGKK